MKDSDFSTPAKVRYIGTDSEKFTPGQIYDAYLIEYWEGIRNSLHVKGNDGQITDFNPLEDFEIISDENNLLNTYEAIVECTTHRFDNCLMGITYGKKYSAIGRDKDGMYLVKDNSYCCYFYLPTDFKIISDEHSLLTHQSIYYSYSS